ncbi:hypothetical protein [Halorubrum ezzemoulense]|uniref:hypothetical protein n=1 Tax=Halorubrum ezzemoulense TaxID=337243 RepID=UPI00232F26EC|nr:hypothetical protein [Halorubrum ezzemoulense]MDB9233353.1 hypothetical protein [Halorubrum ezzemoulense]
MTIIEPEHIEVALLPEQIERLEDAVEEHPDVDDTSELLQLVVADHTGTLDQLRRPQAYDIERIRELLEDQQRLLEELTEEIDAEDDSDLDAVIHFLEDVRERQEEVSDELEREIIY